MMAETVTTGGDSGNIEQISQECCSLCSKPIHMEMWAHRLGRDGESIVLCEYCWCLEK